MIRIFRLAAAGNEHGEFLIRRDVANFLELRRLLRADRLRRNDQAIKQAQKREPFHQDQTEKFSRALSSHRHLRLCPVSAHRVGIATISILLAVSAYSANPFLDAPDDKPVSARFRGTEWGDNIDEGEIALTARAVTTRIAKTPWGAIVKIEFTDLKSRAPQQRKIASDYFVVTDDRIVLLNEENNNAAVKKISAMDKAPRLEEGDVRGINSGKLDSEEGPWTTTIELKGDECIYQASHNSGHFAKVIWKKGVGLIEYSMGSGARADGFRLKRSPPKKP